MEIKRRNGVVSYKYTRPGEDSNANREYVMFDQSSGLDDLPNRTETTVTFGATISNNGVPMRFFRGKLANIDVKMASDLY